MATGDRNNKNKPTDGVRHYSDKAAGKPICKTKNYTYSSPDKNDVCCLKCLKLLKNESTTN